MNPSMNDSTTSGGQSNVQIVNMLDAPQAPNQIEQYTMADGFLEGIPGNMLDWSKSHFMSLRFHTDVSCQTNGTTISLVYCRREL